MASRNETVYIAQVGKIMAFEGVSGKLLNETKTEFVSDLAVTLDGKVIKGDLKKNFRVQSYVYPVLLPDGNLLQAVGETIIVSGSYLGVDDGIYIMLPPLPVGSHTLNFRGTFPAPVNFTLDFTYNLTVQ